VKLVDKEAIIPLRLGAKKKTGVQDSVSTNHYDLGESNGGDELIDEDGLLSEDDLKIPLQQRKPTSTSSPLCFIINRFYSPGMSARVQKEATTSL